MESILNNQSKQKLIKCCVQGLFESMVLLSTSSHAFRPASFSGLWYSAILSLYWYLSSYTRVRGTALTFISSSVKTLFNRACSLSYKIWGSANGEFMYTLNPLRSLFARDHHLHAWVVNIAEAETVPDVITISFPIQVEHVDSIVVVIYLCIAYLVYSTLRSVLSFSFISAN